MEIYINMAQTKDYTLKAINKYNAKFERIQINAPKGTKERIQATGESAAGLINRLVLEYLEKWENENGSGCPF